MKTFHYQGYDTSGARSRGMIEALDPKDAREKLSRRGVLVSELAAGGDAPATGRTRAPRFDAATRSLVYRELGALLHAGLPMDKALELLVQTPELSGCSSLLAGVRDRVRDGASLHETLQNADARVGPFEVSLLQVGESSGRLDDALGRIADSMEEEARIRDHVRTALTYPCIVLAMAAAVLVVMSAFLLPAFQRMLSEFERDPPLLTSLVMGLGTGLRWLGLPLAALIALGVTALRARLTRDAELRAHWHRLLTRVPLFGGPYVNLINLRFARAWSHLLQGGVGITESLLLAARATGNAWVAGLASAQVESIRSGGSAADAVARMPPLAGSLPGWVRAGEASAELPGLLEHAANRFEQAWRREVARKLAWLEPMILLAVAGLVLLIAVAVLLPMLRMNQALAP